MIEIIFLSVLALIWLVFAVIQDVRTHEIANWLNFSLIFFALGFRFFYSLFSADGFNFFSQGLIGFGIFWVVGNLFYYGKLFAGGDTRLMTSLGAILPLSERFLDNLENLGLFLLIFLFVGAAYSLIASFILCLKHYKKFKKEFGKQFNKHRKMIYAPLFFALLLVILGFFESILFFLGLLVFVLPYLYIYTKSIDEIAMVKSIPASKLREGDWLYQNVRVRGKTVKATWDGLTKSEISLLRKSKKKIKIREGIAFTPVFVISFILYLYLWSRGYGLGF